MDLHMVSSPTFSALKATQTAKQQVIMRKKEISGLDSQSAPSPFKARALQGNNNNFSFLL
jgi:hypothetical protein